jgi:hypothetical protein
MAKQSQNVLNCSKRWQKLLTTLFCSDTEIYLHHCQHNLLKAAAEKCQTPVDAEAKC